MVQFSALTPLRLMALSSAIMGAQFAAPDTAHAQGFSLNSDALSSLEEPLATDIGGVTVEVNGVTDARLTYDFEGMDDFHPGFIGNFEVSAATQLGNRWNVGVAYFGQYQHDDGSDTYSDNVAGFVGGSWGTLVGGEVSGVVREETRRRRGAGNAVLAFDEGLGQLSNWGGGYVGQFGPARVSAVIDEDGDFDLGFTWSRPIGNKDLRFGAHYRHGEFLNADSNAITGTAEIVYGSSLYDLAAGYERLESPAFNADRWFVSAGWQTKTGSLTFSLGAHYGETEGQEETSGAFGVRYDVARGLSLNLGINHSDAQVTLNGVELLNREETEAVGSLRFDF